MKLEISTQSAVSSLNNPLPLENVPTFKATAKGRMELVIDGVKFTGNQLINGKPVRLKKKDQDLVIKVAGPAALLPVETAGGLASLGSSNYRIDLDTVGLCQRHGQQPRGLLSLRLPRRCAPRNDSSLAIHPVVGCPVTSSCKLLAIAG
jgi:hypothetical protein